MDLEQKIQSKAAKVGVIGLGYVGLPLALHFSEAGLDTTGFDIDEDKVEKLNRGESYIRHIPAARLASVKDHFRATMDMGTLGTMDAILVCVPTPIHEDRTPDLTYLIRTAEDITLTLRPGQLIAVESSTYPGTTEEKLLPILSRNGLKVGTDFFLVYSPEREDPGNTEFTVGNIPKVIGGVTPQCLRLGIALYSHITEKLVPVSSPAAAEATKMLENVYRAVNIATVNEMKMIFDRMGLDVWEIIEAAKTKPFGFQAFYPGLGPGGHCIPVDPFFLSWKAKQVGTEAKFIELAGEVNSYMPYYAIGKIREALSARGKKLGNASILVLGIAYKKDVDDARESPAIDLMEILRREGAVVDYNDPYIPHLTPIRHHDFDVRSVDLTAEALRRYDCVVLATDHSFYDYEFLLQHAACVVDTKNMFPKHEKVMKA